MSDGPTSDPRLATAPSGTIWSSLAAHVEIQQIVGPLAEMRLGLRIDLQTTGRIC